MKILLDTHMIIWCLVGDKRLDDFCKSIILNPDNTIYYSIVSLWEIASKNFKSPAKFPYNEIEIDRFCKEAGLEILNFNAEHIFAIRFLKIRAEKGLENYDPFDRLLLAQAKTENMNFLSNISL